MTRQMVAPPDHVRPSHAHVPSVHLNLNVRGLSPSAALGVNERSAELIRHGREIFKLGLGQSPFPVPEPVEEALRQNACRRDYLPVAGRTRRTPDPPLSATSIGKVTSDSMSVGVIPCPSTSTVTVGAVRSDKTSTGIPAVT